MGATAEEEVAEGERVAPTGGAVIGNLRRPTGRELLFRRRAADVQLRL